MKGKTNNDLKFTTSINSASNNSHLVNEKNDNIVRIP